VGIGYIGWLDARKAEPLRLLPGAYALVLPSHPATILVPFQVTVAGTVSYAAQYDGALTGQGTTTLRVIHAP
jgi:hypothetical protein